MTPGGYEGFADQTTDKLPQWPAPSGAGNTLLDERPWLVGQEPEDRTGVAPYPPNNPYQPSPPPYAWQPGVAPLPPPPPAAKPPVAPRPARSWRHFWLRPPTQQQVEDQKDSVYDSQRDLERQRYPIIIGSTVLAAVGVGIIVPASYIIAEGHQTGKWVPVVGSEWAPIVCIAGILYARHLVHKWQYQRQVAEAKRKRELAGLGTN